MYSRYGSVDLTDAFWLGMSITCAEVHKDLETISSVLIRASQQRKADNSDGDVQTGRAA
jgi:hypothetical protein